MKQAQGFAEAAKLVVRADPLSSLSGQQSLLDSIERAYGERLTPAAVVERILADVRSDGDAAIVRHTQLISGIRLQSLEIPSLDVSTALDRIDSSLASALQLAASRVQKYHEAFAPRAGTHFVDAHLGRRVLPLDRVGLYVPGGRFAYPSSVLMTAIPAKVAGVREVIVATPPNQQGGIGEVTLAACAIAGVDRVFALGGAQAVAALAYGTESVPRVDKICGPGNVFVTLAKKMVFGSVAIDSLAGPSEVLIIADATASAVHCAADMLAQAEHDPQAVVVLLTDSHDVARAVEREVERQAAELGRSAALQEALDHAVVAVVDSIEDAIRLANLFGPEHLEILVHEPRRVLDHIRNAGCICLGGDSPVVMGDYIDGPSHVLPTGGSARFSSVLSVEDFIKYSSVAHLDGATMSHLGPEAAVIARAEGLEAHARAIEYRLHPPA